MRQPPADIPFPLSSFPGANPQEAAGRLINCYAEPLGEAGHPSGPSANNWRRSPGLSAFVSNTSQTTYRGGLIVNTLSYEVFGSNVITVSSAGAINVLGSMLGTAKVSIARNQKATPDVMAVDISNGAYLLSGGGAPTSYNGSGAMSQPNSVCFQDGYLFFTQANGQCFATALNSTTMNALTYITAESKSDVTLLRGIAFSGYLFLFTTGGCEVWADAATAPPSFPYNRMLVLPFGLIQANAIAGFETGFDDLMWVAQDYGVYRLAWGQVQPQKISPPDLERLIEAQVVAGNALEASVYAFGGKKFWALSCPAGTWEFNLGTQRWNERFSLQANGSYGRWRATGGHPAFGRWIMGDTQTGNLLYIDDTNYTENGTPQLFRMESGPVTKFPNQQRIARADFDMVMGTGVATRNLIMTVSGAASGNNNNVRLTVNGTAGVVSGDVGVIAGIVGTTEANGTWTLTVIDTTHIEIPVHFANAYTSGGTVTDITSAPNAINPTVAISCSKDGGTNWGNPLVRSLGLQGKTKRQRASVKNLGQAGPLGCRWRVDVTDPVYASLLRATMSSDPREY
jgi:hypothetical protein